MRCPIPAAAQRIEVEYVSVKSVMLNLSPRFDYVEEPIKHDQESRVTSGDAMALMWLDELSMTYRMRRI